MAQLTIALRFDADGDTGYGHMKRCLALAEELQGLGATPFAIVGGRGDAAVLRDALGNMPHTFLLAGADPAKEATLLADQIPETTKLIVFDLVHAGSMVDPQVLVDRLSSYCRLGLSTALIDGSNEQAIRRRLGGVTVDLIVASYIGEVPTSVLTPDTRELLGPDYLILESAYVDLPARSVRPTANRILVTCGGADPVNLTLGFLDALESLGDRKLSVRVVIGPLFRPSLKREIARRVSSARHDLFSLDAPSSLQPHMLWCDLALSASGLTKYELAATGTPAIVVSMDRNLDRLNRPFAEAGSTIDLGPMDASSSDKISETVANVLDGFAIRKRMTDLGQRLVDGRGVQRIGRVLVEMANAEREL